LKKKKRVLSEKTLNLSPEQFNRLMVEKGKKGVKKASIKRYRREYRAYWREKEGIERKKKVKKFKMKYHPSIQRYNHTYEFTCRVPRFSDSSGIKTHLFTIQNYKFYDDMDVAVEYHNKTYPEHTILEVHHYSTREAPLVMS